jgi:hypothetical protein
MATYMAQMVDTLGPILTPSTCYRCIPINMPGLRLIPVVSIGRPVEPGSCFSGTIERTAVTPPNLSVVRVVPREIPARDVSDGLNFASDT